jgi:hypothetical protein
MFLVGQCFSQNCSSFVLRAKTNVVHDLICPELLIADLKELNAELKSTHPDLYRNVDPKQLDSAYLAAISKATNPKSLLEFTLIINDFLSFIKDSHTFLNFKELFYYQKSKRHYYPFELYTVDGKNTIVKSDQNQLPIGSELLRVNGKSLSSYEELVYRLTPQESFVGEAKEEMSTLMLASFINLIQPNKSNEYCYVLDKDTLQKTIQGTKFSHIIYKTEIHRKNPEIRFERIGENAVLTISTFSARAINQFKNKLDEVFQDLKAAPTQKLIIDLRNNTGGYILLQEYLMSFLNVSEQSYSVNYVYKRSKNDRFEQLGKWQLRRFKKTAERYYPNGAIAQELDFYKSPEGTVDTVLNDVRLKNKNNNVYRGSCAVVVNGMSMSAAVNFTAWFQQMSRGEVFGTTAMGTNAGTFANPVTVFLKNTALPVMISTMKINPIWNATSLEKAVRPDVIHVVNFKDVKESKDALLEQILSH